MLNPDQLAALADRLDSDDPPKLTAADVVTLLEDGILRKRGTLAQWLREFRSAPPNADVSPDLGRHLVDAALSLARAHQLVADGTAAAQVAEAAAKAEQERAGREAAEAAREAVDRRRRAGVLLDQAEAARAEALRLIGEPA